MSSSLFRQVAAHGGPSGQRAERLFQAAVAAFCSLPRPSRHDLAQIDDLALSLFDSVPTAGRRFAAAALSECPAAPPGLLRRLCEDGVEVAAPLLIRSSALSDADLVSLIARFGLPYAQAIARRRDLHPAIGSLIRAMPKPDVAAPVAAVSRELQGDPAATSPAAEPVGDDPAQNVRGRLRAMMRPAAASRLLGGRTAFLRLRDAALSRRAALFQTALADALGIWLDRAETLAADPGDLALALRALGQKEEEAFLLLALTLPRAFAGPDEAFRFLDHYAALSPAVVEAALERWRAEPQGDRQAGRASVRAS